MTTDPADTVTKWQQTLLVRFTMSKR